MAADSVDLRAESLVECLAGEWVGRWVAWTVAETVVETEYNLAVTLVVLKAHKWAATMAWKSVVG